MPIKEEHYTYAILYHALKAAILAARSSQSFCLKKGGLDADGCES